MYESLRCEIAHEGKISKRIQFLSEERTYLPFQGPFETTYWMLTEDFLFGMIMAVILDKNNADVRFPDEIHIKTRLFTGLLSDYWGKEDQVRKQLNFNVSRFEAPAFEAEAKITLLEPSRFQRLMSSTRIVYPRMETSTLNGNFLDDFLGRNSVS